MSKLDWSHGEAESTEKTFSALHELRVSAVKLTWVATWVN